MLQLTPEILEGAYEFLKTTPPFNRWKLADCDDVVFKVSKQKKEFAHYQWLNHTHTITVSMCLNGYTLTLLQNMAHEMIHMYLEERNMDGFGNIDTHNTMFKKLAAQVCKYHGFDPKAFYY